MCGAGYRYAMGEGYGTTACNQPPYMRIPRKLDNFNLGSRNGLAWPQLRPCNDLSPQHDFVCRKI